jgi:hypothetical protein
VQGACWKWLGLRRLGGDCRIDGDGVLRIAVPVGIADAEKELEVTVEPVTAKKQMTQEEWAVIAAPGIAMPGDEMRSDVPRFHPPKFAAGCICPAWEVGLSPSEYECQIAVLHHGH